MTAEALNSREAALLAGISERTWERLSSAGKTPSPIRLGRSVRWRKTELEHWLAAGCPPRDVWQARGKVGFEVAAHRCG